MTDIWDLDPDSIEGMIARPYYLSGYWQHGPGLDRTAFEKYFVDFLSSAYGA